jgi:outer membrane protein assembly factor BamB
LAALSGPDGDGILRCLHAGSGEQIWEDRTAVPPNRWATIHLIRRGEQTWMFNERGELIIAKLTADGFQEISRAKLIEPATD